jgi:hypothetical protein
MNNLIDATVALGIIYNRFILNRIRFEILSRLVGTSSYVPALQAMAMESAMDTLLLLGKT